MSFSRVKNLKSTRVLSLFSCLTFLGCATAHEFAQLDPVEQVPVETASPKLSSLIRFTVGPSDEYQLTGDESRFFYTKSENLASTIMTIERVTQGGKSFLTEAKPIFDRTHDTKDPSWNPRTKQLAFVSFEKVPEGRCVFGVLIQKLKKLNASMLGEGWRLLSGGLTIRFYFLKRPLPWQKGEIDAVMLLDLANQSAKVVARYPRLASITVHPQNGNLIGVGWLASALENEGEKPHFVLWTDLSGENANALNFRFEFPGFPVAPQFSEDGGTLIFGQFVDDSNNDARLDGDDKSAILSVSYTDVLDQMNQIRPLPQDSVKELNSGKDEITLLSVIPNQLTESAFNCLYPHRIVQQLYLTCATGRSLDLFALKEGQRVPKDWGLGFLYSAREEARDPATQILLTHRMIQLENESNAKLKKESLLKDLISLHAENEEFSAAKEVFKTWVSRKPQFDKSESESLFQAYLDTLELVSVYRNDRVSLSFQNQLRNLKKRIQSQEVANGNQAQGKAVLLSLVNDLFKTNKNHKFNWEAKLGKEAPLGLSPSLAHLAGVLLKVQHAHGWLEGSSYARGLATLSSWVSASRRVSVAWFTKAMSIHRNSQKSRSANQKSSLPVPSSELLSALVQTEKLAQEAASEEDDEKAQKLYRALNSKLTKEYRKKPFLKRAHYALVSEVLSESERHLLLAFHTANWLSFVSIKSFEYDIVLAHYRKVVFRRGYAAWNEDQISKASDIFYTAARLTRDEEAHLAYVLASLEAKSVPLEKRYSSMEEALGELWSGRPIYNAVTLLVDYHLAEEGQKSDRLDEVEKALSANSATSPLIREFLKGVVFHERFLLSLKEEAVGDVELFLTALRHYQYAKEWAASRPRMKELMVRHLGSLFLAAGQASPAAALADELQQKEKVTTAQDVTRYVNEARALGLTGRSGLAAERLGAVLAASRASNKKAGQLFGPKAMSHLKAKRAYYLAEAKKFKQACKMYSELVDQKSLKLQLGQKEHFAWTCLKAGQKQQAVQIFKDIIKESERSAVQKRTKLRNDRVDFHPALHRARAAGFLASAQADNFVEERKYRSIRKEALEVLVKEEPDVGLSEGQLLRKLWKNEIDAARSAASSKEMGKARIHIEKAQQSLKRLVDADGIEPNSFDFEGLRQMGILAFQSNFSKQADTIDAEQKNLATYRNAVQELVESGMTFGSWGDSLLNHYAQVVLAFHLLEKDVKNEDLAHLQSQDEMEDFLRGIVGDESVSRLALEAITIWYQGVKKR